MKEFGSKNLMFYYVVYRNGDNDMEYENDKKEIIEKWDCMTVLDAISIVKKCEENPKPFNGIPCGEDNDVYAIAIDASRNLEAAFFHIVPRDGLENIA